jgi:hypothetical protein
MREDRCEFACLTRDISPGGIAITTEGAVRRGERIVAYVNRVGRVEGIVARIFNGGFAIEMKMPASKREKLADQLTWLANQRALGLAEDRRHERIVPRDRRSTLRLQNGSESLVTLIDISISGAAFAADESPPISSTVIVGSTAARVVRHFAGGVAVEFNRWISEEIFSDNIKL